MVAVGKRADLDFKLSTNAEKAISDMARIIARQDGMIKKTRQSATEARKSQRAMGKAMKKMEEGGTRAAKSTSAVSSKMSGVGKVAQNTLSSITSWVAGFATIAGVSQTLNTLISQMREAAEMRKEMLGDATGFKGSR